MSDPLLTERTKLFSVKSDWAYLFILYGVSGLFALICVVFLISVIVSSIPAWRHSGLSILYGRTWSQASDSFGALPIIVGTLLTTAIALVLAIPIGIGSALAIVHVLPGKARIYASSLVELLAAVPSVVYGLWGLLVLAPWFEKTVEPDLADITNGHWPFDAPFEGVGLLLAGCVLFVMILPMIVALSRDAIAVVPNDQFEGALSVGATKWQVLRSVVLPAARTGIVGAVTLATARALGETVAVAMVIGLNPLFPHSLFSTASTLASTIALEFQDATPLQVAALGALAVILMAMTAIVNWFGRRLIRRSGAQAQFG
ncbi:MAG: phosphate ABC transporter permease subunit PstC [Acidimicrobiales bacterium]|jgi:phosphate transport system permease protein